MAPSVMWAVPARAFRALGPPTGPTPRASRGLEIAGFQIMLMVAGVSQGVGGVAYAHNTLADARYLAIVTWRSV